MSLSVTPYTTLRITDTSPVITFGVVAGGDIAELYAHRTRVYKKYGYIHTDCMQRETDEDVYDTSGSCIYVVAVRDGRPIASLRIVLADVLPIDTIFTCQFPDVVRNETRGEISRLVVERSECDKDIPRNILMLFLMDVALRVAEEKGVKVGVAFIKQRLLKKLALLRFPITTLPVYTCVYPHNGCMAPYFYNQPDDVPVPSFVYVADAKKVLDGYIRSGRVLESSGDDSYTLRVTLYTSLLTAMGIL